MGFTSSREEAALTEAKRIREDLYKRVDQARKNYQRPLSEILEIKKQKIRKCDASTLADMIDSGQVTSLEVMYAFIQHTMSVGIENNYVLDEMFEEALEEAKKCDEQRKSDGYSKKCWRPGREKSECYPPFYGVPTSMKETMIMKNRQTHVGFVSKINPIPDEDGHFALMVRKMGFIPFVRTNVPQGCKTIETNNNIFGYSKNPWNKQHTCGGSSGGQSGIVAAHCAPIGFGSDIGGSVRIPASFTGLSSLKPWNRYSRLGNCYYGKMSGGIPVKAELAPITRSTEDLILCNNFLFDPENYEDLPLEQRDPVIPYRPMNMKIIEGNQKMKIGLSMRLKTSRCTKPVERALLQVVEVLRNLGHQVVDIGDLGNFQKLYFLMVIFLTNDGNLGVFKELQHGEPLTKEYKLFIMLTKIPWIIRKIVAWLIKRKEPRLSAMINNSKPLTSFEIFEKIYEGERTIGREVYNVFAKNKLDAILMPTFATPAPLLGKAGELQYFFSYCASWNFMHYPAGVLPITLSRADELDFEDEYNDFYTKNIRKAMKTGTGLPVAVQIASTPYNEQKILYLMKQIQEKVQFHEKYQIPDERMQ